MCVNRLAELMIKGLKKSMQAYMMKCGMQVICIRLKKGCLNGCQTTYPFFIEPLEAYHKSNS